MSAIKKVIVDRDQENATVAKLESEGLRVVRRRVSKDGKVEITAIDEANPTGRPGIQVKHEHRT